MPLVEVRCPVPKVIEGTCHPGKLFMLLRLSGERPQYVHPDNLIELNCPDCKWRAKRAGRPVRRVVHRFDLAGNLVETFTENLNGSF